ncbi:hypothetical protein [Rubripirellula tenax]|nr:hypothetical protein [Rubripirellula tenax]
MSADHGPFLVRFRWPITLTLVYGVFAFAGSGLKSQLFFKVLYLMWLIGGQHPSLRKKSLVGLFGVSVAFILLLPAFQAAKDRFAATGSRADVMDTLIGGIDEIFSSDQSEATFRGKPWAEGTWEYFGNRLCMANMTRKYLNRYGSRPLGAESIETAFLTAVPRIIDPTKISTDQYYNDLARNSGIGNYEDRKTSRKPTFMDESIIVWGRSGFLVGGGVFGVFLLILEWLAFQVPKIESTRIVLRFTWLSFGTLPYFGIIFGSISYCILFSVITIVPGCSWLWLNRHNQGAMSVEEDVDHRNE